jgi:hypothetical protein
MKYYISKIDRTIELDDELMNEYCKYEDLRETTLLASIYMQYGKAPTKDEMSDEEFSKMCNEILYYQLKAVLLAPITLEKITQNREEWHRKAIDGEFVEIDCSQRMK